ncbi:MAG: 3-hydroxyacyl-CoA dehydrogenase family protein, partial [Aerococcus sp.]|nr:3-hydroxyacyl-CoA dehydrogenase family protein [Aerococcus sp.]
EETIFATNTSSLRPSNFMEATGRTDRFLALHFQNEIWKRNIAEVMGTSETSDEVVKTVEQFAKDIEMDPIVMKKEQPGYINNTLFIPFVNESLRLFGTGEGAPYDIDRAWMKATNSPQSPAPFSAIDIVGFGTPPEIAEEQIEKDPSLSDKDREGLKYAVRFLRDSIQLGRGGKVQGEGFYHYDDNKPEFLDDDFLEDYPDISIEDYGKETGDENKDKAIYLFTRVSTALITGALELYAKGAADVEDIDKVWRSSSQSDLGPFDLIKKIGADKVYDVLSKSFADIKDDPQKELHDKMLDALKENKF